MHNSDTGTGTYGDNDYAYRVCRRCQRDIFMCICWRNLMNRIEWAMFLKLKREMYKHLIIKSLCVSVVTIVRKTPFSLSGMKGLALLKKEDKRKKKGS